MIKIPVGIIGATGMVGQRFITLLSNHPWFEITCVAASPQSAGKKFEDSVEGRWVMENPIPGNVKNLIVRAVEKDMEKIAKESKIIFSALDMDKEKIKEIEIGFAKYGIPVVSNNSAHRWTKDVPMVLPEINPEHLPLIKIQQKNRGWDKGFIVVKPNCSAQSYMPLITPLLKFQPKKVVVTTLQSVSGAGKTLKTWPEMFDNVIPFISGEEEKSEKEPMKIWGKLNGGKIIAAKVPEISATCIRVPTQDGHMASVTITFSKKTTQEKILKAWQDFNPLNGLGLPFAPDPFIEIMNDENRPQTKLDRNIGNGMSITVGRLRQIDAYSYSFVGLSHNTIRGAAGGAILTAELLKKKGYI